MAAPLRDSAACRTCIRVSEQTAAPGVIGLAFKNLINVFPALGETEGAAGKSDASEADMQVLEYQLTMPESLSDEELLLAVTAHNECPSGAGAPKSRARLLRFWALPTRHSVDAVSDFRFLAV